MSQIPHLNEIPKPNFIQMPIPDKPITPPHTPDRITVQKRGSASSTPPDSPSRANLQAADKKALKTLISLTRSIDTTVERLYSFCEHIFNEKFSSLLIDYFEKHVTTFRELNTCIVSQNQFEQSKARESTPSPVSFNFPSNMGVVDEDWPNPISDQWLESAQYYINGPAAEKISSPKREALSLDQKLLNADQKRRHIENMKRLEIRKQTNRVRRVVERRIQQSREAEEAFKEKIEAADQRRDAILNQKVERARNESEKASEYKYIVDLEQESKRVQLNRKSDEIKKRHDEMVRTSQEKARERTISKSSPTNLRQRKMAVKKGAITLAEALRAGQIPGDFAENAENEDTFDYPKLQEPKESLSQHAIETINRIESDPTDPKNTARFLKLVSDYRSSLCSSSRAGLALIKSLKECIRSNANSIDTMIRHVTQIADTSLPFAVHVGVEAISVFPSLCKHTNSLNTIKELITLWTRILDAKNPLNIRIFFVERLSQSAALDGICFLLGQCSVDDLSSSKILMALIASDVSLLQAMADLFFNTTFSEDVNSVGIDCISRAIGPSIIDFLNAMSIDTAKAPHDIISQATIALSTFIAGIPGSAEQFIDENIAAEINSVMRAFLSSSAPCTAGKHLIVLFGLLCKSNTVKESCLWLPSPTVLDLLCGLPLEFFIKRDGAAVLLPTIAACCSGNEENLKYIMNSAHVNESLVAKFLARATAIPNNILSIEHRVSKEDINVLIEKFSSEKK